jgi:hypothetical protein
MFGFVPGKQWLYKGAPQRDCSDGGAGGFGQIVVYTAPQIEDWLRNHREFAVQIDDQCNGVRPKADANWPATTEGRVCTAARNAAMFYRQLHSPPTTNGEKFGPGLH